MFLERISFRKFFSNSKYRNSLLNRRLESFYKVPWFIFEKAHL
ncbi:hypothetical protein LEP1GSC193_3053 [Leptospira alstonii serovar Pingchang str. 80-412]|uniref:Uncharacterized protein n=2 Tax=Leptospira alstonii TaxID=28452 RepID=M6CMA1_9LEPT|nr:hypothetical protein LEP1GSC194_4086 [Leptospira alstonii serovar Sichuan str. 79601]EQA79613.1 hypothetical protein LEP1GSC193_3053 [Leptospira alstonii serovar Pingchang str. 80-412]